MNVKSKAIIWLLNNYIQNTSEIINKSNIYHNYCNYCKIIFIKPIDNNSFGKCVHKTFPNIKSCRKGPRGYSSHCYKGISKIQKNIKYDEYLIFWLKDNLIKDTTRFTKIIKIYEIYKQDCISKSNEYASYIKFKNFIKKTFPKIKLFKKNNNKNQSSYYKGISIINKKPSYKLPFNQTDKNSNSEYSFEKINTIYSLYERNHSSIMMDPFISSKDIQNNILFFTDQSINLLISDDLF